MRAFRPATSTGHRARLGDAGTLQCPLLAKADMALSLLKIISGRSDDAIRTELAWRRSSLIAGQRVVAVRPWPTPSVYGFHCSRAHIASGPGANAVHRRSATEDKDPTTAKQVG